MRTGLAVLVCLLISVCPAAADDKPAEQAPPKPLTPEQAADAVLAAVKAEDEQALKALAEQDKPDPWLVADELCYRGEHDAAEAFARAAPRTAIEKLPDYLSRRRTREPDRAQRDFLASMNAAMRARAPLQVVEGTAALPESQETVVDIRLSHVRGIALRALQRFDASKTVLQQAGSAARAMGWLGRSATLYDQAGISAHTGSAWVEAISLWRECAAIYERIHDGARAARALGNIGNAHFRLGDYRKSLSYQERALTRKQALGDTAGALLTLGNIAPIYSILGDYPKALAIYEQVLAQHEDLGNAGEVARTLSNIGTVYRAMGSYARALTVQERALASFGELGNRAGMAHTLNQIGDICLARGDYGNALSAYERSTQYWEALGHRVGVADTLDDIGNVHEAQGSFTKALSAYQRALGLQQALGNGVGANTTLGNIGNVHFRLGDYAKALSTYERVLVDQRKQGAKADEAAILGNVGNVHWALGDYASAIEAYELALKLMTELGNVAGQALTLGNIGVVRTAQGDYAEAQDLLERSLALHEEMGEKTEAARTLGNIGNLHFRRKEYARALSLFERALAQQEALGDEAGAIATLSNVGAVRCALGDHREARRALKRSARGARSLRATPLYVRAMRELALLHLKADSTALSLAAAKQALTAMETLLGGLGEEQGAMARAAHSSLFAVGTLAATREDDPAEALTFMESGRAGALLDALGKREVLRWKSESLPPELRDADHAARAAQNVARREYDSALPLGELTTIRQGAKALDEATERVREVGARIQRELKARAGLYYPRAETIENIESALEKDQALVLFGLCLDEALALVLRQDGERIVSLGKVAAVEAACEALDASDVDVDPSEAIAKLRKLLVEPLGLADDVRHVLVSPEGALCYVPFGALLEQTVTMTPSGTTHVLLLDEEREPGKGILSLGDPDYSGVSEGAKAIYYRGRTLAALPATGSEVEAIGTTMLLGANANEAGLREALPAQKRWKAVHFACHGLIDVERPMLSSLALSSAGEDDGFLTALEVLRMEIPADLAVLSACETGKGRVVKGEGIVGLTRAFMFAGAPRVICSLWKVDDKATQALMIKFYELWNPKPEALSERSESKGDGKEGLGAAAALKKAQEFIKGHEKWKHPYYWAAWVLWGLPE